ncbi:MAG: hypothetical protein UV38_C0003G0235 [candidate division TM6 bacterium GW2011_GWE2_42_60]|nr:MAG: hypothetical protein UV38_C0003G0235 [candidate division TM6 bacterium GW2011_GWE2_42_60]HBY05853.1 hypothetical protein [Candidatus Dependentiae bacterium]
MKKLLLSLLLSATAISSTFTAPIPDRRGVATDANERKQREEEQKQWAAEIQKMRDEQNAKTAAKLGTTPEMLKKADDEMNTVAENLGKMLQQKELDPGTISTFVQGFFGFLINPESMKTEFDNWKKSMSIVADFFNSNQALFASSLNTILSSPTIQSIIKSAMKKYGVGDMEIAMIIAGLTTLPTKVPEVTAGFKKFADAVNTHIKYA